MNMNFRNLRKRTTRERPCGAPIRTDVEGVKNLYNKQGTYTVSLNDQMELFYEKCKDDELTQHEVAYYFHAELLPLQLEEKFRDKKNKFIFKESKENKFYLYAGVRGTLIFHPQPAVLGQRTRKFSNLAMTLSGMIYVQFWPECCPTDIPETTEEIKVIGTRNFKRQHEHKSKISAPKEYTEFEYLTNRIPLYNNNENYENNQELVPDNCHYGIDNVSSPHDRSYDEDEHEGSMFEHLE